MAQGRPKSEVDEDALMDMLTDGWDQKEMASALGVSAPTLRKRIVDLKRKEGEVLQYRLLQSLELTTLEAAVLERITPEKIKEATLRDLVYAFKVLKEKELVVEGRPSDIKGLVGYLMYLDKEERGALEPGEAIEAEFEERNPTSEELEEASKGADNLIKEDEDDDLEYSGAESEVSSPPFPPGELPDL